MSKVLKINLLASVDEAVKFDKTSTPLVVNAFEDMGHEVTIHPSETTTDFDELLEGDVFIDRSPITDSNFFRGLALAYRRRRIAHALTPLMVDNPLATILASDKRKTHALFPELVPESYNLDGVTNSTLIGKFEDDEKVVIKDPFGWFSHGTELLSPEEAQSKHVHTTDMIVQKYIPFAYGVGRVLVANYEDDFEVLSTYLMIPDDWRTGEGVTTRIEQTSCPPRLKKFARDVTQKSGIYLNGIDFIEHKDRYILLENNTVPNLHVPLNHLGIDVATVFAEHVERNAFKMRHAVESN